MGLVYGRMSFAQGSRLSSGDHHTSCSPSKTKPDFRGQAKSSGRGRNLRRRSSGETDGSDTSQSASVRLTRQASRRLALQNAAQQATSLRRSPRLASKSNGHRGSSSANSLSAGAASLPSTLRRSARIAGFRSIGHRVVVGPRGGARSSARGRPGDNQTSSGAIRRSARLARAQDGR
jgi:hypothetical protein